MPHCEQRNGIEAAGKHLSGAINERLAGAGGNDLTRAFQPSGEPARSFGGNDQANSHLS
jgi:hypothetical protein